MAEHTSNCRDATITFPSPLLSCLAEEEAGCRGSDCVISSNRTQELTPHVDLQCDDSTQTGSGFFLTSRDPPPPGSPVSPSSAEEPLVYASTAAPPLTFSLVAPSVDWLSTGDGATVDNDDSSSSVDRPLQQQEDQELLQGVLYPELVASLPLLPSPLSVQEDLSWLL
jgi:hypothetical protein